MEYPSDRWNAYIYLYTDVSKSDSEVCAASNFFPHFCYRNAFGVSGHISLITADLVAILSALYWTLRNDISRVVILAKSLSALHTIITLEANVIVYEILHVLTLLFELGIDVAVLWVPAHVGIRENKIVVVPCSDPFYTISDYHETTIPFDIAI